VETLKKVHERRLHFLETAVQSSFLALDQAMKQDSEKKLPVKDLHIENTKVQPN
jgi:hypothetical protein